MRCFVLTRFCPHLISFSNTGLVYVAGGADDTTDLGDLWTLDLENSKWSQLETKGDALVPKWGVTISAVGDKVYVFGGMQTNGPEGKSVASSDLMVLETSTLELKQLKPKGLAPWPRAGHSFSAFGERFLVVFGGSDGEA